MSNLSNRLMVILRPLPRSSLGDAPNIEMRGLPMGKDVSRTIASSVEMRFREAVRAIEEGYRLQKSVVKALAQGTCPMHFQEVWDAHVRPEVIEDILTKVASTLFCEAETDDDTVKKLVLLEMISSCDMLLKNERRNG